MPLPYKYNVAPKSCRLGLAIVLLCHETMANHCAIARWSNNQSKPEEFHSVIAESNNLLLFRACYFSVDPAPDTKWIKPLFLGIKHVVGLGPAARCGHSMPMSWVKKKSLRSLHLNFHYSRITKLMIEYSLVWSEHLRCSLGVFSYKLS